MADNQLFSFQGRVNLGARGSNGKIAAPKWVGDATLSVAVETESVEHKESFSGQRIVYGRLATGKSATVTLTLFEATRENLAIALYATEVETAAGAVTAEAFPDDVVVDTVYALDRPFVSNLVLTDVSSTTLQEGVHYVLENAEAGHVKFLDLASFTQPISAAYDYQGVTELGILNATPPERWVQLVGVNTLNNEPVIVDLFRVRFDPASQLPMHNEEFGSFELTGSALVDALMAADSNIGGFGKITLRNEP